MRTEMDYHLHSHSDSQRDYKDHLWDVVYLMVQLTVILELSAQQ